MPAHDQTRLRDKHGHDKRRCRVCHCTDTDACRNDRGEPCYWVAWDLCSECVVDTNKKD